MRSCKCFVVIVSLAILTLAAPLGADEPRPERAPQQSETQPNETQPNETEALREEVRELRERLARLEGLLGRVVARASDADALPALAADPDLTPGEARFMNASQPAALPPYSVAGAAAPAPAAVPAPAPQAVVELPAGVASTGGQPLAITGLLDTYYTRNFNNPADGTNTLYYTNPNSRGFGLNQAKLEIDAKGKGPVGFRSDIWFGSGARLFREGLEPGRLEDVLYLQQAYGYYQWDNGAELDVGLFSTIAGLEVAESHLNWNYTRGILWAWNEPFSHLGAKFSAPLTDTLTGTVMLVNGFDNVFDQNSGSSYGTQGSWAPSTTVLETMVA